MTVTHPKPLHIAIIGVGISALLHAIGPFIYGWGMPLTLFLPIALLYLCFIMGLKRQITWVTPIVLLCMVIGGFGSLYEIYRVSPVSDILLIGIALADFVAAGALITHYKYTSS